MKNINRTQVLATYKKANKIARAKMLTKYGYKTERGFIKNVGVNNKVAITTAKALHASSVKSSANQRSLTKQFSPKVTKTKPQICNMFLLDDSSSMDWDNKREATIDGFNQVLQDIKTDKSGVKSNDVLFKFGSPGNFDVIEKITELNKDNYHPKQNSTALYDSIVKTIDYTEGYIKNIPSPKVVLTIFTDGEDNSSKNSSNNVKKLIDTKVKQGWVVNFMGAGEDAFVKKTAATMGINMMNTNSYQNTGLGTTQAFNTFSKANQSYRSKVSKGTDSNIGFFANDK